MLTCIQYTESFAALSEARDAFDWLASQVDYLGGRLLEPSVYEINGARCGRAKWLVQVFFDAHSAGAEHLLPDGCRLVVIPDGQIQNMGIDKGKVETQLITESHGWVERKAVAA